ncbi:hypothetical protein MSAN_02123900 [Mycena sanguinolenta]|uniref:Uncharacterized protein n=1 Tax=Mycena sanguinolenta TaxID=230812 RepID=A0A8H7CK02_9AGAR|nr:hypothetical protein MSAN_02123900 [Mycena sanguinolenta]
MHATSNYPQDHYSPYTHASTLAFRNKCTRRGCGHIFEYDGPNPLGNIQRLVREHSPVCRGLKAETTQMFWRRWEPSPAAADALGVDDDTHTNINGNRHDSMTMRKKPPFRGTSSESEPSSAGSSYTNPHTRSPSPYASASTSTSQSSVRTRTTRATRLASPATSTSSTPTIAFASAPKKTARSEAERRLALESDLCALKVTPHDVLCAGCQRVIKLDRRSRYYPGLWEKHRERCEGVERIEKREALERSFGHLDKGFLPG